MVEEGETPISHEIEVGRADAEESGAKDALPELLGSPESEGDQFLSLADAREVLQSEVGEMFAMSGLAVWQRKELDEEERQEEPTKADFRQLVRSALRVAVGFGEKDPELFAAVDRAKDEGFRSPR